MIATAAPHTRAAARRAVREQLEGRVEFARLTPDGQRALAASMVRVAERAAELVAEDQAAAAGLSNAPSGQLSAGDELGLQATRAVATTTRAVLSAISFPRFVEELVNGVFRAMIASSIRQMDAFVDLLDNVSASLEGFASRNLPEDQARQWLADTYPGSFEVLGGAAEDDGDGGRAETGGFEPDEPEPVQLRLRPGASFPPPERLREDLGLGPTDPVPSGNPEALVALARQKLARTRQEMLASMVMLGLQRLVIDQGMVRAGMRFHIDARSAAAEDRGSRFDLQNTTSGSGSFGVGAWGASASMTNTIGYVSTNQVQTTEEIDTSVDVDSAVEIHFRSDQLPLSSLAGQSQAAAIQDRSRNPDFAPPADTASARRAAEASRRDATRTALAPRQPVAAPPLPPPPAGGARPASGTPQPASGTQPQPASGTQPQPASGTPQPASGATPR